MILVMIVTSALFSCRKEVYTKVDYSELGSWKIHSPDYGDVFGNMHISDDSVKFTKKYFGNLKGRKYKTGQNVTVYDGDSLILYFDIVDVKKDTLSINIRRTVAFDAYKAYRIE